MSTTDEYGRTALHYAADRGSLEDVVRLLDTEDVNERDHEDWAPLHFAAQAARPDVAWALLDAGADIDALTSKGYPAIYWAMVAAAGDPVATIRLLRARGADPAKETMKGYFGLSSPLDAVREWTNKPEIKTEFTDLL